MFKQSLIAAAVLGALVAASSASAAIVVDWNLTGAAGSQATNAPSTVAANITGLNLTRGAGLSGNAGANSMNAAGWNGQATDYFSLGFTVASGYTVDLDDLFVGTRSSATGPGTIGVFYSGNSFASAITTISQAPGGNFVNSAIDLSALPDLTGTVEFRFQAVGAFAANSGAIGAAGTFRVGDYFVGANETSNLALTGLVSKVAAPVPEPTTTALLLVGLATVGGLVTRRRGK